MQKLTHNLISTVQQHQQHLDNGILLHVLEKELTEIGMEEITLDENGYLFATLPANTDKDIPVIGFLAHVDTATDYTGKNVNPQQIDNYEGNDIRLSSSTTMKVNDFPELKNYVGHTLITTDGRPFLVRIIKPELLKS